MIPFGEYRADVSDFQGEHTAAINNVLPRGDGYGPLPSLETLTDALPAACRGYIVCRNSDGSVTIFAGTSTELYKLDNTNLSWAKVSLSGGPYSALADGAQWQFRQFGLNVIAVHVNVAPQVWLLGTSSAFANLGGSPPQAAYVTVVFRFLMLSGISGSPYKIKWSALNDITEWTPGTDSSGEQEFTDGGAVMGVSGGEYGVVFQESAIRHMTYLPNNTAIFDIDKISDDDGLYAPYSMVRSGPSTFFLSRKGFRVIAPGGLPQQIGAERVDRTFFETLDEAQIQLVLGSADPGSNRILWVYKSTAGTVGLFDRGLWYDYQLNRWTPCDVSGEYLAPVSTPGTTLEALDAIVPGALAITGAADSGSGEIRITVASTATLTTGQIVAIQGVVGTTEANDNWTITVVNATTFDLDDSTFANAYVSGGVVGGSLDDFTLTLDEISIATLPSIAVMDPDHKIALFSGDPVEAILETAEQGMSGQRFRVHGFQPITDASSVFGSVGKRETPQAARTYTDETEINSIGVCPANISTRYARGKIRIPAGTDWNFAAGLEPDFTEEGRL